MISTRTAFFCTPQFPHNLQMIVYNQFTVPRLQYCNNHTPLDIISADAKMSKGFADLLSQRIPGLRDTCRRTNLLTGQAVPFWDQTSNRYIYNLVTKTKFSVKPNLPTLSLSLEEMKSHARLYGYRPLQFLKLDADLIRWTGRRL